MCVYHIIHMHLCMCMIWYAVQCRLGGEALAKVKPKQKCKVAIYTSLQPGWGTKLESLKSYKTRTPPPPWTEPWGVWMTNSHFRLLHRVKWNPMPVDNVHSLHCSYVENENRCVMSAMLIGMHTSLQSKNTGLWLPIWWTWSKQVCIT